MSILDWFRKHHPQPPAPPPPAQGARLVSMDVSPTNTTCVLTPQGDYPIAPITATEMVPEAPWHKTFQVGADVPPWGGDVVCSAPGYIDQHFFWLIPPTDTQWPSVTLQPAWPALPSRDQVCRVNVIFQGLTVTTQQFGTFPAFGPETSTLNDDDLQAYFAQCKAAGATHVEFAVSWNYQSQSYSYPVPGRDLSQNLPELKRRIALAIQAGFYVLLFCAGDGLGSGPNYNDPVGWTYGREWLLANFQRIYDAMGPTDEDPRDCRPFMVFLPGYDGTDSYGWETPDNVVAWWQLARGVIDRGGAGYLGQEWSYGHCQLGGQWDGAATYVNGPGQALDVILQEFPADPPLPGSNPDAVWQMVGRMVSPYHRPPQQPSSDDPNPPYYLTQGTPRGPYYYIAYEYDTYHWVRGRVSAATVAQDRAYLRSLGCTMVC